MKISIKLLRETIKAILTEDFASSFGVKSKWIDVKKSDTDKDPDLGDEVMDMLGKSYASIGGHLKLKTAGDVFTPNQDVEVIDADDDPHGDAFDVFKKTPSGMKFVAAGTDGTPRAKELMLSKAADSLNRQGNYAEVSGGIAHILLTKFTVPVVSDRSTVEKALGQPVQWIGPHPEGKYPGTDSWYSRSIGGQVVTKIMVGKPS